jgi:hypothetical protein
MLEAGGSFSLVNGLAIDADVQPDSCRLVDGL